MCQTRPLIEFKTNHLKYDRSKAFVKPSTYPTKVMQIEKDILKFSSLESLSGVSNCKSNYLNRDKF